MYSFNVHNVPMFAPKMDLQGNYLPCHCHRRQRHYCRPNGMFSRYRTEGWEWVEIIEPRSKEHMYANLTTGECVWDPPPGVKIKKTDNNQWWELFDPNTSRFYYYNATSQKTVWHRPQNCDIIPLAKLQRRDHTKHVRTGSLKSTHTTQTSPSVPRKHRFNRQDSASSQSSSSHHESFRERNGDRVRRRSSQSSQSTQAGYSSSSPPVSAVIRRDTSLEMAPRVTDSPRLQKTHSVQRAPTENVSGPASRSNSYRFTDYRARDDSFVSHDLSPYHPARRQASFSSDREYASRSDSYGSTSSRQDMFTPPLVYSSGSQDVYSSDINERIYSPNLSSGPDHECIPFSQDIAHQQGSVSPSMMSQKPRSFPRTNPAYVGVPKRNGSTAYKRLNVEQQAVNYDPTYSEPKSYSAAGLQVAPKDYTENYYYPHERSDSDTSHSSIRAVRHDRTDSQASHSSRNRESDSHSSQGSFKQHSADIHTSNSSLRMQSMKVDPSVSYHESVSSRGSERSLQDLRDIVQERPGSRISQPSVNSQLQEPVSDDSEPDYANVPPSKNYSPCHSDTHIYREVLKDRQNIPDFPEMKNGESPAVMRQHMDQHINRGYRSLPVIENSHFPPEVELNQSFDEDEINSNFFTAQLHERILNESSYESHHASLKRKKPEKNDSVIGSPVIEKSHSMTADILQQRPASMVVPTQSEANVSLSPSIGSLNRQNRAGTAPPIRSASPLSQKQKLPSDSDIENYMNRHKKGLFGKKISFEHMLIWSKDPIQKPILRTEDKAVKKEACEVFKLIQIYMGDRKARLTQMQAAQEIISKGWSIVNLRDEIYMQLCKQTTENRKGDSLQKGWEMIAICLYFFPPSTKFSGYLEGIIAKHLDESNNIIPTETPLNHFAVQCQKRLEKIMASGPKKGQRKPNLDEIEQAKKSVFSPSMFGSSLDDIMLLQKDRFPDRKLPWIQTTLSEEVLRYNGAQTEGIFRVPGDIDEVNVLKLKCDQWSLPSDCVDPHIPASLLKLWYRELYEPLIPAEFYDLCILNYQNPEAAIDVVSKLPDINRLVLAYLIRFLQVFAAEENSKTTKMDVNNLAMVMAPNCLRCECIDPHTIFENTRKEMGFIRTLIQNLDTSFMEGIV
ncbi:rho GTPase-activating protein 39-like isoform X15 [Ostrea edulis]|uniref:rho GTPase-activating protein 39-like isoform X15 n=1 Tax=Ostrea edulis TaxID=37623 RepID=UPI0024AF272D|nr:rho GTPase-activating protein 39-like isoform X15 [Ostrea edulis]